MSMTRTIKDFVTLAIKNGGWTELDRIYLENKVLALIGAEELVKEDVHFDVTTPAVELADYLVEVALKNQPTLLRECLEAQLMDIMTPPPSVINALFAKQYDSDPVAATDYFFKLSQDNDYIKTRAIAKNIVYHAPSPYGELEITINLSKPEKDPKQIAAQRTSKKNTYPQCLLCMENEGYLGSLQHPARSNHRIIRLNLNNQSWGFQYSPYAYYNEHSIFLAEEHRPMRINQETFENLLRIVSIFPHYFVGSNADLPIVGGSILSHDHYQGGRHTFPMAKAPIEKEFQLLGFPQVTAGIVKWPMSVIRLQSQDADSLAKAAAFILVSWQQYSDSKRQINAFSNDGTAHHTVTPIARKNGDHFVLDIVLRDNNVSDEHPDGIFHPHQEVHHIKKENIGLIEVMGLAVLPPRLKTELVEVERFLLDEENQIAPYHLAWAQQLKEEQTVTQETVTEIVQQAVGDAFAQVLADAGVYKRTPDGQAGFSQFIATLT